MNGSQSIKTPMSILDLKNMHAIAQAGNSGSFEVFADIALHWAEAANAEIDKLRSQLIVAEAGVEQPASLAEKAANTRYLNLTLDLHRVLNDEDPINDFSEVREVQGALVKALRTRAQPELYVWFGSMPESNGRENWTVTLCRKEAPETSSKRELHHLMNGFTVFRSEYKDRMRYEADRLRFLIGETDKDPDILDYDADLHSGYVAPGSEEALVEKKGSV